MSEAGASRPARRHVLPKILALVFCVYAVLPAFGIGSYRNGSGQRLFDLWYLLGFLIVGFFLIHEIITPLPPKEPHAD